MRVEVLLANIISSATRLHDQQCYSLTYSVCYFTYLPACLPACLPIYLPTYLPAYLPACLSIYLPTCLPIRPVYSICLFDLPIQPTSYNKYAWMCYSSTLSLIGTCYSYMRSVYKYADWSDCNRYAHRRVTFLHQSIYLSCLPAYLSTCLPACLPTCLSTCLSIRPVYSTCLFDLLIRPAYSTYLL